MVEKNWKYKIDWLKNLVALALLAGLISLYFLIKGKKWDDNSDAWEFTAQIVIELISTLIIFIVIYYSLIRYGISSENRFIDEISQRLVHELNNKKFYSQEEADLMFDLKSKLNTSKEVFISGYSCRYLISSLRTEITDAILKHKTTIKILVVEPGSNAANLLQENHSLKNTNETEFDLVAMKEILTQLVQNINSSKRSRKCGQIELRYISWIPSCSLIFSIPKNEKKSVLKVKIYAPSNNVPLPKIITHFIVEYSKNSELFNYFYDDFHRMWNRAKPDDDITIS